MLRNKPTALIIVLYFGFALVVLNPAGAQSSRHIKVLVDSQQQATGNQEEVQGTGSIIIRRGSAQPSGRVTAYVWPGSATHHSGHWFRRG